MEWKRRGRHRKSPFINTSPSKRDFELQNLAEYHLEERETAPENLSRISNFTRD